MSMVLCTKIIDEANLVYGKVNTNNFTGPVKYTNIAFGNLTTLRLLYATRVQI